MMNPYETTETSLLREKLTKLETLCNEQAKEIFRLKEENYKLYKQLNTQVPITVEHSKH